VTVFVQKSVIRGPQAECGARLQACRVESRLDISGRGSRVSIRSLTVALQCQHGTAMRQHADRREEVRA
jgi:hypothetical protein